VTAAPPPDHDGAGTGVSGAHAASHDAPPAGHGHLHLLRHGPALSRRAMRFVVAVLVVAAAFSVGGIVVVGGMVVLWPHHVSRLRRALGRDGRERAVRRGDGYVSTSSLADGAGARAARRRSGETRGDAVRGCRA